MSRLGPWLIALLASVVAALSWFRAPPEVSGGRGERASAAAPSSPSQPVSSAREAAADSTARTTRACLATLERTQAALTRCRAPARNASSDASAQHDLTCLKDSVVKQAVERRIDAAIEEHIERERERSRDARARERSAFDEWSSAALQLSDDEREWLVDYVCAARELRERTLRSLDERPPAEALEQLKRQRKDVLKDLEDMLGEERYKKLRAIGGIGLLADTTECD